MKRISIIGLMILALIMMAALLFGCDGRTLNEKRLSELKSPVIIVSTGGGTVIVVDSLGTVMQFPYTHYMGQSLSSLNRGDTIK